MEKLNAIALTFLRPQLNVLQLNTLYQAAGNATAIVENRNNLPDILPDVSDGLCKSIKNTLAEAIERAKRELEFCEKHSINVLTPDQEAYPQRLLNCEDAPIALYFRGSVDLNMRHIVCIIGTRKCTVYGQDLIRKFVIDLKKCCPDTLIVSGLAYGVDINAHRSALDNGMDTVGVLAHGLDMIYPSMHRETAKRMLSHGGLLTEFPSETKIDRRNFLQRNRIVAGLSDACILPESASHGGGLVTCRISNDYGRNVYAFPGPVDAEFSQGCNNLIRTNGAQLITCAADFVADMGWDKDQILAQKQATGIERTLFLDLNPDEQCIVDALHANGDLTPDQLTGATKLPVATINASLFMLEMNGVVKQLAGSVYHLLD